MFKDRVWNKLSKDDIQGYLSTSTVVSARGCASPFVSPRKRAPLKKKSFSESPNRLSFDLDHVFPTFEN